MISRRNVLSGLAASTAAACSSSRVPTSAPYQYPIAPPPPDRASLGLDAVIDISRSVTVTSFREVRQSNILGVIHKATEGGDHADPACAARRPQAEAAGLLWGTYHFGTGQYSGAQQAALFLSVSRPGPKTLLALDLEANDNNPSNSMRLDQAEDFVRAVAEAMGRLPVVYVHPTWANGDPLPGSGLSFGARITPDSILARCGLWVADYHDSTEIPLAWAAKGWRLWQYAGDESASRPAYGQTSIVQGVSHCDRNLFNGDATGLDRFWIAAD
ncbi:MAG: glycoside hydrolase family 25 protein [Alphaproteobacteria bacterium]|nr:glycoside hydrolase family 25 protein [Alphaproteobacteria bacterium]